MTDLLRAVPERQVRALGLVRVSREREGMVSPEVQRVAIGDYCAARGYQLLDVREGLDQSGSRARSAWWPTLDAAVADVEAGEYDVIVTWKFSRIARHRLRWAVAVDRVEEAGGRIESATEQVDTSTSTGRFTRGMLAELQAFEAERIGEIWREVHARRVKSGKPANGKPRFGYRYDLEAKLHVPDPETGPVLADLYRRYVAGESVYALVRWLNGHGWRTTTGGVWSDRSLRRVLDSGFASGRFMAEGTLYDGVHEPLIDSRLWQAYLDARVARRARPARTERSAYLLSGLVRCGRCEGSMVAGQYGRRREPKYRCKRGQEQGPEVCAGGYVMAAYVEREVLGWLAGISGDVDEATAVARESAAVRAATRSEGDRLARQVVRVEEALTRLAVQDAERPLPESVYRSAYDELTGQLVGLQAALEEARRRERGLVEDPAGLAADLLGSWGGRPVEHRREALRKLVCRVVVWTGRPRAIVRVVPVWEA